MSRVFPILIATVLVAGTANASTHQSTSRVAAVATRTAAYLGSSFAQEDVAAKVKAALKADPDLASQADAVTVTGAGGVVTLEGTVPSVQVRAKIGELVKKVEGVTKLVNKLKLAKK